MSNIQGVLPRQGPRGLRALLRQGRAREAAAQAAWLRGLGRGAQRVLGARASSPATLALIDDGGALPPAPRSLISRTSTRPQARRHACAQSFGAIIFHSPLPQPPPLPFLSPHKLVQVTLKLPAPRRNAKLRPPFEKVEAHLWRLALLVRCQDRSKGLKLQRAEPMRKVLDKRFHQVRKEGVVAGDCRESMRERASVGRLSLKNYFCHLFVRSFIRSFIHALVAAPPPRRFSCMCG